jgi:outer membrane protein OmpA-like peptidoglycan-associated protein
MYFGLGLKFQIPIISTYEVLDGKYNHDYRLNVSGYFPGISGETPGTRLDMGAPENEALFVPAHGFGSINNPNEMLKWNGDMNVKFNVAGSIEGGFLIGLNRRIDMNIGAYLDYGFIDIKNESKKLLEAPEQYQPGANDNIGNGIAYSGIVNSNQTGRINTISYGGKIGIRVKIGKLEVPTREDDEERERLRREEDSLMRESQMDLNKAMLNAIKDLQKGMNEILTWKDMVDDRLKAPVVEQKKVEYPYNMTKGEFDTMEIQTYFTLNSAELRSSQKVLLDRKIEIMKQYPHMRIQVAGNTCDLGTAVLNGNLGLYRAKAVRDYMISKGISESRVVITTKSYNNPLLPNVSEENRSLNRRCDYEVITPR